MAVELPSFVDTSFLQTIFERNFAGNGHLKVEAFWGEFATKPGQNYSSNMYRINVDYELNDMKRRKSIILKVKTSYHSLLWSIVYSELIKADNYNDLNILMFSSKLMPRGGIQEAVMIKNELYPKEIYTYRDLLKEIDVLVVNFNWNHLIKLKTITLSVVIDWGTY